MSDLSNKLSEIVKHSTINGRVKKMVLISLLLNLLDNMGEQYEPLEFIRRCAGNNPK